MLNHQKASAFWTKLGTPFRLECAGNMTCQSFIGKLNLQNMCTKSTSQSSLLMHIKQIQYPLPCPFSGRRFIWKMESYGTKTGSSNLMIFPLPFAETVSSQTKIFLKHTYKTSLRNMRSENNILQESDHFDDVHGSASTIEHSQHK